MRRFAQRVKYLLLALTFVSSLTTGSVVLAASTETTGDITGAVTDQNGTGLSGIKVSAYSLNSDHTSSDSVTWTAGDGSYDLSGLPTGDYDVLFNQNPDVSGVGLYFATQWYHDQLNENTAATVSVNAGATTEGINEDLMPAGVITGKITDDNGGGVAGIKVDAFTPDNNMESSAETVWSGDDGTYYLNLPANNYILLYNNLPGPGESGAYFTHEWYDNQPTGGGATPDQVSVNNNEMTADINATLDPAGAVSGRVMDENGQGIPNIKLTAYASMDAFNNAVDTAFVATDENGDYFMGGLPGGSNYIIDFNGPGDDDPYHLEQYYNGQSSPDTANPVTVANNATTPDVNATLQTLGAVSGTATDTTGAPAQVYVSAYATASDFYNNTPAASAPVNSDGSYSLIHLPAGNYYIYFASLPGYFYVPQFYNSQPTIGTATTVAITKGQTTENINATLALLPASSGSIEAHTNKLVPACMGPDGDALPGICQALFAGESTTASADVNVHEGKQGSNGGVTFTYSAAGHTFKLVSKSISQFYVFGTNNASAGFEGTGTLTVDGTTTTNQFRVIVTDGKLLGSKSGDQFGIYIWAPGANPSTTQPQYFLNKSLPNGNVTVKP